MAAVLGTDTRLLAMERILHVAREGVSRSLRGGFVHVGHRAVDIKFEQDVDHPEVNEIRELILGYSSRSLRSTITPSSLGKTQPLCIPKP